MKKPTSRIRQEIARLQEQLREAETRDAERIGRIALKAGLGEFQIDEEELKVALEDVARRFRRAGVGNHEQPDELRRSRLPDAQAFRPVADQGEAGEG